MPPSSKAFRERKVLMRYLPLTDVDRREMLARIGAKSVDELFRDVPLAAWLPGKVAGLPDHQGELEVERAFQAYARRTSRHPRCRSSSAVAPTAITCRRRSTT